MQHTLWNETKGSSDLSAYRGFSTMAKMINDHCGNMSEWSHMLSKDTGTYVDLEPTGRRFMPSYPQMSVAISRVGLLWPTQDNYEIVEIVKRRIDGNTFNMNGVLDTRYADQIGHQYSEFCNKKHSLGSTDLDVYYITTYTKEDLMLNQGTGKQWSMVGYKNRNLISYANSESSRDESVYENMLYRVDNVFSDGDIQCEVNDPTRTMGTLYYLSAGKFFAKRVNHDTSLKAGVTTSGVDKHGTVITVHGKLTDSDLSDHNIYRSDDLSQIDSLSKRKENEYVMDSIKTKNKHMEKTFKANEKKEKAHRKHEEMKYRQQLLHDAKKRKRDKKETSKRNSEDRKANKQSNKHAANRHKQSMDAATASNKTRATSDNTKMIAGGIGLAATIATAYFKLR